jgi:hypothetical protein
MITQSTALRGCWQLVFHAALTPAAARYLQQAAAATGSSMDQHLQQLADEVLQQWPGWELIKVQQIDSSAAAAAAAAAVGAQVEGGSNQEVFATRDLVIKPAAAAATARAAETATAAELSVAAAAPGLGLFLTPVAITAHGSGCSCALHDALGAPPAAAAAGGGGGGGGALVELHVAGFAVQQLLRDGRSSLRAVVSGASRPHDQSSSSSSSSSVLLDQEWDLQQLAALAPDTPAAAAAAAEGAVLAGGDHAQAVSYNNEYKDACLRLHLCDPATAAARAPASQAAGHAGVYSVVVIAAPSNSGNSSSYIASSSAAAAHTSSAAPAVIACLPLLVLPAAAQQELQQLFTAAVAAGLTCSQAYQQLLPMLQDWATVLLWPGCSNAAAAAGQASSAEQPQQQDIPLQVLYDALSAGFAELNMPKCLALLTQQHERQQQQQQVRQQEEEEAEIAAGSRPAPMAAETSSSCSSLSEASRISAACMQDTESCKSEKEGTAAGSSCSRANVTTGPAAAAAACSVADPPPHATAAPSAAYSVTWRTILFGFSDAAVQQEYVTYRSAELKLQDYGVMLWYSVGVVAMLCKGVLLVASSNADAAQQLWVLAVKGSMVCFNWLPFLLLWSAASNWNSRSSARALLQRVSLLLLRWRGAVIMAALVAQFGVIYACLWVGGLWGVALADVAQQYNGAPALLAAYNHVVQPLLFRAPSAVLTFCALLRVCIESEYPPPTIELLRWLSHDAAWVLLASGGLWLAVALERSQQRRFARAAPAAAAAAYG